MGSDSSRTRSILSLEQTPALAVPLKFMLTAPFFAALAALVVLINPDSLDGRWNPSMLAVTHLMTLGFITMVMVGALQQLFPILVGVPLPLPVLLSRAIYFCLVPGVLALCSGFLMMNPRLLGAGSLLVSLAIILLVGMLLHALTRSNATFMVTTGMKLAVISFLVTILFGLALVRSYIIPELPLPRNLTNLHVEWGLLGWVGLLIFTVSYQVVPMFQVTPKYPDFLTKSLSSFVFACLVGLSLVTLFDVFPKDVGTKLTLLFNVFLMMCFMLYAFVTLSLQRKRKRKVPDITLSFWRLGLTCLLMVCFVLCCSTLGILASDKVDLIVGLLMLAGFAMSLITGMLYKIIPFLVWLHLTNEVDMSLRWQLKIPNMKKIVPDKRAQLQFNLHLGALILLLISLVESVVIPVAAALFLVSNLSLAYNLIKGANVYRQVRQQVLLLDPTRQPSG